MVVMIVATKRRRLSKSECHDSKGFFAVLVVVVASLLKLRDYLLLLLMMF